MVKFHESSFTHSYPFPTVTLAYFLRYPNPYASHVLSTDVIDRYFDPSTQTLYTARLHLKRSKLPKPLLKLLPRRWLGTAAPDENGESQTYILERSIVAVKDGVMVTESRNLDYTGVLAVVERQLYRRPGVDLKEYFTKRWSPPNAFAVKVPRYAHLRERYEQDGIWQGGFMDTSALGVPDAGANESSTTEVLTNVELHSRLGESGRRRLLRTFSGKSSSTATADSPSLEDSAEDDDMSGNSTTSSLSSAKPGFFASLTRGSLQRSVEAIGLKRTERAVPNSKAGMNVVLERLRSGGLIAVLEGMRHDREGVVWRAAVED